MFTAEDIRDRQAQGCTRNDGEEMVQILRQCLCEAQEQLEELRLSALRWKQHPDWPWIGFVQSAATLGGSWRWHKNVAPRYDSELSWNTLLATERNEREQRFQTVGRFRFRAAAALTVTFERICKAGGPAEVRAKLQAMTGHGVIAYLKEFPNIGDKYSRNIMMDVYDERFRCGYFAIDRRIIKLLPRLGYEGHERYEDRERFLNELACRVGVDSWTLDRLLYTKFSRLCDLLS